MALKKLGLRSGRPSEGKKERTLASLADSAGMVRVNFDLDKTKHRNLKIKLAQEEKQLTDVMREFVDKYLSE